MKFVEDYAAAAIVTLIVAGVVGLMISLLVIQILTVQFFGLEPRLRPLEQLD